MCFTFRAEPQLVLSAMKEELVSKGWTYFEGDFSPLRQATDGTFYKGVFRDTSHSGIPTTELVTLEDYAWFDSDLTDLNLKAGATCAVCFTKRSNLVDLYRRLTGK